jgi:hypothetical protein
MDAGSSSSLEQTLPGVKLTTLFFMASQKLNQGFE